jgi:hypothetical protein
MKRTGPEGSNTRAHVGSSSQGTNFHPGQQIGQSRMQVMGQGCQTPQCQIQRTNFQSPRSAPPPPQINRNAQNSSVPGSRQIRTSTAMLTTVQPLQQGKIKPVLA